MHRASYCNVYINQRDAQILVNNLYFFIKWLYTFRTNDSPKHVEPFNEKIKTIHNNCASRWFIYTSASRFDMIFCYPAVVPSTVHFFPYSPRYTSGHLLHKPCDAGNVTPQLQSYRITETVTWFCSKNAYIYISIHRSLAISTSASWYMDLPCGTYWIAAISSYLIPSGLSLYGFMKDVVYVPLMATAPSQL